MATTLTFEFLSPRSFKVYTSTTESDTIAQIIIKPATASMSVAANYTVSFSGLITGGVSKQASTGKVLGNIGIYFIAPGNGEATVIYPEDVIIAQLAYRSPESSTNINPYTAAFKDGDYAGADAIFDTLDLPKITPSFAQQLATPTGLTADQITSTGARIGWNAVENATDYKVEYRRQGDTTWNE